VTVDVSPGTADRSTERTARALSRIHGVRHVERLRHRYAYVGADLQDLYGVDPSSVVAAGRLQDAYFQGGSARDLVARLAQRRDSLLVSAETVHDFQLRPGDAVTLRLQDGRSGRFIPVRFHYVGVVKEFPTAPRDSFLVANGSYVAERTHDPSVGTYLVDTGGQRISSVAGAARSRLGTSARITDLVSSRKIAGSSLTAVDLAGLARLELAFAFALGAAAAGLTVGLGFAERRRTFNLIAAIGGRAQQVGAFVWVEAGVLLLAGLALGSTLAWALANMLVKVLTGVFDPPPAALSVPWVYLGAVGAVCLVASVVASTAAVLDARKPRLELLRSL
jgi:putative ABC transport system permease protein